jgi:hypothetical protein
MGKVEKDLAKMRQHPLGWRYDQVARILKAHEFTTDSKGTSHRWFKHPSGIRVGLRDAGSGTLLPVYVEDAIEAIDKVTGGL